MEDITNIFLLHADAPVSSSDWKIERSIISDIDVPPANSDPLAIEFGFEQAHILYQTIRNDSTGVDRLGLWYAHGEIEQPTWSYRKAIGDEAALPQMTVIVEEEDEEERIVALWREGSPQDSELVAIVADSTFRSVEGMETRLPARGLGKIGIVETERGVQVIYDHVGPSGPQVEYGVIDHEENWIGLSNRIVSGQFDQIDRFSEVGETVMILSSPSGWQIRSLIDDDGGTKDRTLAERLRYSLGLDESNFEILVIGVAFAVLILGAVTIVSLSAQGVRWVGRKRLVDESESVLMEEDVVDLIEQTDLAVGSNEVEVVVSDEPESELSGSAGRRARRESRIGTEEGGSEGPVEMEAVKPIPSIPTKLDPPSADQASRPVVCVNCGGRFVLSSSLTSTRCPICDEKVGS
tara:strand:- start:14079 stop:15302 length:1224 start_codon:yes stop_codon:yes gene_type:complete